MPLRREAAGCENSSAIYAATANAVKMADTSIRRGSAAAADRSPMLQKCRWCTAAAPVRRQQAPSLEWPMAESARVSYELMPETASLGASAACSRVTQPRTANSRSTSEAAFLPLHFIERLLGWKQQLAQVEDSAISVLHGSCGVPESWRKRNHMQRV